MLSSVLLSSSLFSLFVWCAPAPYSSPRFDALQTTGFARDLSIPPHNTAATSQIPSFDGAFHSQPNVMSDPSNPTIRPADVVLSAPIDPPSSQGVNDSTRPLVMAYYPDWAGSTCSPENINFTLFDWIDFAFALPDENFGLTWDSGEAPMLLDRLVHLAHGAGTKVKLSIGGWTGSKYFSPAVATNASRAEFAGNILQLYYQYNVDGIDIDWEYPGLEGASGNIVDSLDVQNFLLFLRYLRATLPPTAIITAAVPTLPFADPDGSIMRGIAAVLDWVLVMDYDVWQSSSNPGPNAPMHDGCNNSTQPDANAVAAYDAWTKVGFSASQIVFGLAAYGYVSKSNATSLRTRSNSSAPVTVLSDDGQVPFNELVSQGALVRTIPADPNSPGSFSAAGGFEKYWDSCSGTPFLRSVSAGQVISYDDPKSLEMKAQLAKELKIRGTNMFDICGDTDRWDLTNSVRKGMGLS